MVPATSCRFLSLFSSLAHLQAPHPPHNHGSLASSHVPPRPRPQCSNIPTYGLCPALSPWSSQGLPLLCPENAMSCLHYNQVDLTTSYPNSRTLSRAKGMLLMITLDSSAHHAGLAHWGKQMVNAGSSGACLFSSHLPSSISTKTPRTLPSLAPDGVHSCAVHTSWWFLEFLEKAIFEERSFQGLDDAGGSRWGAMALEPEWGRCLQGC